MLIVIGLLIPILASANELPCHSTREKRTVIGSEPTASILYAKIRDIYMGSWKSGFWDETFTYVGDTHTQDGKTYKIGYLVTIWGESCRATRRLFVFDHNNDYLGQYYGIMLAPTKIVGATLYFPFKAEDGNTLSLEAGPPKQAWLDGENPEWASANTRYSREDCIVEISVDMHNQSQGSWIGLQEKILKIFTGTKDDDKFNLAAGMVFSREIIQGRGYIYIQYMNKCEQRIQLTHYLFDKQFSKEILGFPNYVIESKHVKPGPNTINMSGPYWQNS
jgi:hypothetical protein